MERADREATSEAARERTTTLEVMEAGEREGEVREAETVVQQPPKDEMENKSGVGDTASDARQAEESGARETEGARVGQGSEGPAEATVETTTAAATKLAVTGEGERDITPAGTTADVKEETSKIPSPTPTGAPSAPQHHHQPHHHHHHVHHHIMPPEQKITGTMAGPERALSPPEASAPTSSLSASLTNLQEAQQEQHAAQDLADAADPDSPYRPLNVRDALHYLDTVKSTFGDSDNVYALFLSCMREFKSQAIDTPQVIARVTTLFRGHPFLIRGFNTFLPPGYRIESLDPYDSSIITVTTPRGTTTQSTGDANMLSKINAGRSALPSTVSSGFGHGMDTDRQSGLASNPAAGLGSAGVNVSNRQPWRGPVEFNHAMSFVNKIKMRFHGGNEIYRKFLTILQMYQREDCDIGEVYQEVTILFKDAPDLLEEFRDFLPDASGNTSQGGIFGILSTSNAAATPAAAGTPVPATAPSTAQAAPRMPPMGNFAPSAHGEAESARPTKKPGSGKKKKVSAGAAGTGAAGPGAMEAKMGASSSASSSKDLKRSRAGRSPPPPPPQQQSLPQQAQTSSSSLSLAQAALAQQQPAGASAMYGTTPPPLPYSASNMLGSTQAGGGGGGVSNSLLPMPGTLPPAQPAMPPGTKPIATADEMTFFDRVKKFVDDRAVFAEFLKLCNLYSQDIIDQKTVVERARPFIGASHELFAWFINFVGYDPAVMGPRADGEDFVIYNVPALLRPRVDLNQCKAYGPSYRKLPKSEASLACSGRDAMCWEVLNDEWVSHPTWASEDAGFVAHKKNIFEEALHKCEEERYEYDYHIEANLRTICWLEPIAHRIAAMSAEERAVFRLRSAFNASGGRSIYIRVIKKVYGPDRGQEIINALQDNPCVAVPVILRRLKQKDAEWKRSQREWERVWREIDAKNFYKSLDHAGTSFKAGDKKLLASKALVAEIEALKREGKEAPLVNGGLPSPRYQFDFDFSNDRVLKDLIRLLFTHIEQTAGHSANDKERADGFLRQFLPMFFGLDKDEVDTIAPRVEENSNEGEMDGASEVDGMSDTGSIDDQSSRDGGSALGRRNGAAATADLRRRLLKSTTSNLAANRARGTSSVPDTPATGNSTAVSPQPEEGLESMVAEEDGTGSAMEIDTPRIGMDDMAPEVAEEGANNRALEGVAPTDSTSQIAETLGDGAERPTDAERNTEALHAAAPKTWIQVQSPSEPTATSHTGTQTNGHGVKANATFFTNTGFFVALRLIRVLYERLLEMKIESDNAMNHAAESNRLNATAVDLGLQSADVDLLQGNKYDRLIALTTKLIEGEMEQTAFEENVRFVFGIRAYKTFTFDKVIQNIIKHMTALANDPKTEKLMALMDSNKSTSSQRSKRLTGYRKSAEGIIGSEEMMFRIDWIENLHHLVIQLLDQGHVSFSTSFSDAAESQWAAYVANYTADGPTEGVTSPARPPFLKRSIEQSQSLDDVKTEENTKVRIAFDSYRMFYVPGGEDTVIRQRMSSSDSKTAEASTMDPKERLAAWLEKDDRWSKGLSAEEKQEAVRGQATIATES